VIERGEHLGLALASSTSFHDVAPGAEALEDDDAPWRLSTASNVAACPPSPSFFAMGVASVGERRQRFVGHVGRVA